MKRGFTFHTHTVVFALVLAVLCLMRFGNVFTTQNTMPDMGDMDALFKDFDFNKFVAELEKELAVIEKEEAAKKEAGTAPLSPDETGASPLLPPAGKPIKPTANPTPEELEAMPLEISDDPAQLIKNPPIQSIKQGTKTMRLPHKKAERALQSYVADIITALEWIDQVAMSINNEEFHEYYKANVIDSVIETIVTLSVLVSKRAYRVAVLAPPPELEKTFEPYRKRLIEARSKLMRLADEIDITEEQINKEEADARMQLEKLAQPQGEGVST